MANYMLEGFNIEFNKEEKRIVFYDKDKIPILKIEKMEDCLLLGDLFINFYTNIYFDEVSK